MNAKDRLKELLGFDSGYAVIKCKRVEWSEIESIIAESLAAQEAEIARLRDLIEDSRYFVAEHARKNPKWEHEGRIQDPDGVHALLLKINADILPPDEKKEEP